MISLYTDRLIIRSHKLSDLQTHHELFSNKKAMFYLQDIMTFSFEESEENLRNAIEKIENPACRCFFLRIEEKQSRQHVGEIGYTISEFCPQGACADIGYFLRPEFWGKGYAAEALREVIRFAFCEGGVYRLSCGCLKENAASEKVMQKSGLIKESELKEFQLHEGILKDRVVYRLLKHEWKNKCQH